MPNNMKLTKTMNALYARSEYLWSVARNARKGPKSWGKLNPRFRLSLQIDAALFKHPFK